MDALELDYDIEERRNGWVVRFPANDETALWRGPYKNRAEAEQEAMTQIEAFVTAGVLANLGLK